MRLFLFLIIILNLQSCAAPIIGGVGAIAFSSSAQEKGLGTSINDKVIYVKLRNAVYDWNPSVSENISLSVDNGSILITGKIKNIDTKVQLTKIIWEINGVKEVNNKVQITSMTHSYVYLYEPTRCFECWFSPSILRFSRTRRPPLSCSTQVTMYKVCTTTRTKV